MTLVTGGQRAWLSHNTSEMIFSNGTAIGGPDLLAPIAGHCMAEYNGTIYFLGSWDTSGSISPDVLLFDQNDNSYRTGPNMHNPQG